MNISTDYLFAKIGALSVELELVRQQNVELTKQLEEQKNANNNDRNDEPTSS